MKMKPSLGLAAALLSMLVGGCLVAGSNTETRSGNYVEEETFSKIEPGSTSAAWVKATLGEPSEKTVVDGGSEVWKWTYTEVKKSSGAVFLLFGGSSKKETTGHAFVELKDGVVARKWRS